MAATIRCRPLANLGLVGAGAAAVFAVGLLIAAVAGADHSVDSSAESGTRSHDDREPPANPQESDPPTGAPASSDAATPPPPLTPSGPGVAPTTAAPGTSTRHSSRPAATPSPSPETTSPQPCISLTGEVPGVLSADAKVCTDPVLGPVTALAQGLSGTTPTASADEPSATDSPVPGQMTSKPPTPATGPPPSIAAPAN